MGGRKMARGLWLRRLKIVKLLAESLVNPGWRGDSSYLRPMHPLHWLTGAGQPLKDVGAVSGAKLSAAFGGC